MRYLLRFLLLTAGFALTTAGLAAWHDDSFRILGMWPPGTDGTLHPVYLMVLGLAMIPPALWEIFLLEVRQSDRTAAGRAHHNRTDGAP